ncbi:MAG TPA: dephospho-CoA kinase [Elusimicrobiota bacterium]|nr:dephospho-CoA kinase [Elusimicrobiota bacterium]
MPKKPLIIGVTGGFGSGKSTVLSLFRKAGIPTMDADELAHQTLRPRTKTYSRIIRVFGESVLSRGGVIDRKKMASIIFKNRIARKRLEGIIHPAVVKKLREGIRNVRGPFLAVDIPLLFEAKLSRLVDLIVVVWASPRTRTCRLSRFRGYSDAEIRRRSATQINLRKKCLAADRVIDNDGNLKNTREQVRMLVKQLKNGRSDISK